MSVIVVGINHRCAALEVLEAMAVRPAALPKALGELAGAESLSEVVVVSTCTRTEIYAVASRYHRGVQEIQGFLSTWSGLPPEAFTDHVYAYHDDSAVRHLFRVSAGVDSAVLGEGEILRQVTAGWQAAHEEGASGPVLAALFRRAAETGKRVRTETRIATGTASLSQAAVAMASARLGGLAGRTTLVVGAGEMGEAMAVSLAGAPGAGPILVANRTAARAEALAARLGGGAVAWADLGAALRQADVLLTSTGASELLLDAADVEEVMADRGGRPLLAVDIAVPRDIDPAAGTVAGVTLLDIGDLTSYADVALAGRRAEVPAAEAIVVEELDRWADAATSMSVAPVVAALQQRGEAIRQGELERLGARLGLDDLDPRTRRAVEALSRGIVAKLLHEPTVSLKAAAGTAEAEVLAQSLCRLFDL